MITAPTTTPATGLYDGPGAYLTTSGAQVWLDVLPQPYAGYVDDDSWLILSHTLEEHERPLPKRGTFWGRRELIEPTIVRKIEGAGQ